ncbi:PITH domain-containing protein [Lipomyces tetrasporus]|uniref:PITH domain-containing protein n=1 Tax=Lipomyces tetrasporus TaxID=54092 RepID=A0AAD7VT59_9ASCO|nr:PITH domain-containing protein [Lipomyces tetrasporus]KAJ8099805.1 PITH domain-containing protein [Lipomyces tetrasporus]
MASAVQVITNAADFAALNAHDLAVIDFNAVWCGPCKTIAPHFEKFPEKYPNVIFASVDIDKNKEIAGQFKITAVPTFLFLAKGREVARVRGANLPELESTLRRVALMAASAGSSSDAPPAESSSSSSPPPAAAPAATSTYQSLIPKGLEAINHAIEFKNLEALNATSAKSTDITASVRDLFSATILSSAAGTPNIESDADSQLLFYVPFMNATKVHSVLIQAPIAKDDNDQVKQRPTKLKVWTNLPAILSFDDTNSVPAVHEADIDGPDEQGWSAVRLRYVRFQRVSSLVVFLEGEDEDEPTGVNKVVFVGEKGDKLEMGTLAKPGE